MAQEKDRCPLCKRKLMMTTGVPTCPDCGFRDPYGTMKPQSARGVGGAQVNGMSGNGMSCNGVPGSSPVQKGNIGYYSAMPQTPPKKDNTGLIVGVTVGIAVLVVMIVCGVFFSVLVAFYQSSWEEPDVYTEAAGEENGSGRGNRSDGVTGEAVSYRPQSDMLIELVEIIFEKDMEAISSEEINSIVYLDFYELGGTDVLAVDYELADGTGATCIPENQSLDVADLNCFGGLEWLMMDQSLDWHTDWSNLQNLYGLSCDSSMSDIAAAMDASQLVWLQAESSFMSSGFGDAEEFENLEYLEIDADYIQGLEGISELTSLRKLILTDADGVDDFEELYSMPQLETVCIESKGLRDIGFLREMENLTELELTGTSIKTLDALEDCADTLKVLRLEDNFSVEDYSVVLSCTGLQELALHVSYNFDVPMQVPDLSAMTDLKVLTIENYDKFDNLGKLTGLEELTISSVASGDGSALAQLQNLRVLNLTDMSVYDGFLDEVPSLPNLETLDLTDSFIWTDIAPVFAAPSLKRVYLNDADAGFDMRNVKICESLTVLDMTGTRIHRLKEDGSWDYQAEGSSALVTVQDMEYFFDCLPNLEALYLPGHELEDITFLADKTELYYLDVSDNYITDLSPLSALSRLEIVVCEKNPLHNREGLEDVILLE